LPEAVQDSSLDPVLGVTMEDYLLFRVVLGGSVEQAQDARVNQIV
jgi:hypothetical protein